MEFQQRLPHNLRETIIFMAIISIISVNIIAPVITGLEIGFSISHYLMVLKQLPLLWLSVIILVVATQKPAEKLGSYFLDNNSSFRSTMFINAACNVLLMSLVLTIVGTWIGTGNITMDPIVNFFAKWPRNYTIALIIEAFVAQPIARGAMSLMHRQMVLD
ncbi:hypothetical protein [Companilactobacillus jidongensis]|uniref:hypothetical protein n=1 Tax=Companilactobacillus jidongensis TaxID=2486006 RepID=UPI000F7930A3|nr:hypothetical protein [Companilactobacillus jidongensis]